MAEGFKIADAFVEVTARIDDAKVEAAAAVAGQKTGDKLGSKASESASRTFERDARGRFLPAAERTGSSGGTTFGRGLSSSFRGVVNGASGIGSIVSTAATNPYALAGMATAGALLAPILTASLGGAIIAGAGTGVIGLGFAILKEEPAVKAASKKLGDTAKSTFLTAAKPLIPFYVEAFGIVEKTIKDLAPQFKEMFANVGPAIKPITEGLMGLVKNLMPGLLDLTKQVAPLFEKLGPAFANLGKDISKALSMFAATSGDAGLALSDLIGFLGWAIVKTAEFLSNIARGYSVVRAFFTVTIPNAINTTMTWFRSLGAMIAGWWTSVTGWFSSGTSSIRSFFSGLWTTIQTWGANVGSFFSSLPGRIASFLSSLPGVLKTGFTTAMRAALYAVGYAIGAIIDFFIKLPGRARAAVSSLWSAISGAFNSARTGAINAGTSLVNGVVNFFRTLPGRARSAVSSLWSSMVGAFNSAVSQARARATALVNGTVSFLRTLPGKARSAVSGIKNAIISVFSGAASWLYSAGANILRGLANGIKSAVGGAISAARSAVGSVISGAKDALGISSPSKVAAKQVGRWILPGVMKGVSSTVNAAKDRFGSMLDRIVTAPKKRIAPRLAPSPTNNKKPAAPWHTTTPPKYTVQPVKRPAVGGDTGGSTGREGGSMEIAYNFYAGAIQLDVSKVRTIRELIDLIESLRLSARSYAT